jgi:hypothetical protein
VPENDGQLAKKAGGIFESCKALYLQSWLWRPSGSENWRGVTPAAAYGHTILQLTGGEISLEAVNAAGWQQAADRRRKCGGYGTARNLARKRKSWKIECRTLAKYQLPSACGQPI